MNDQQAAPGSRLTRRRFVVRSLAVMGAGIAAALAAPIAGFMAAPGWQSRTPWRFLSTSIPPTLQSSDWSKVASLADLEVGVPQYVLVDRHVVDGWVSEIAQVGVHVVRESDTEVAVFDPHCTHLGCPLSWSEGSGNFVCPCHGGSFAVSGDVLSGPPPASMFRYQTRIDGGDVYIGQLEGGV